MKTIRDCKISNGLGNFLMLYFKKTRVELKNLPITVLELVSLRKARMTKRYISELFDICDHFKLKVMP